MKGPRVHDGRETFQVIPPKQDKKPVPPVLDGDDKIFVSIASFRDGERCGETLKSLFENAKDPDKIVVGLVEQNAPEDKTCLEVYCDSFGVKTIDRRTIREGVTKVITHAGRDQCPHYEQIRLVAWFHITAKGPMLARSMARKVLGNEEFCMQIDAHTSFTKEWDAAVREEWKATENEFGIISTVPAPMAKQEEYEKDPERKVPRQCKIGFQANGFLDYESPADGAVMELEKPLLSHGWSAAFSFAKCHLEESAPYDPFMPFAKPVEQFSRFVRFWTRGYDVYTPTRNIVFHDYQLQPNGHGNNEWFRRSRDRFRKETIQRAKTVVGLPAHDESVATVDPADLGIYGIGKRRTVQQLEAFANLDLAHQHDNREPDLKCSGHEWVPYDASISPVEHFHDNPDNLDPQPEYALRTDLTYYKQVIVTPPRFDFDAETNQVEAAVPFVYHPPPPQPTAASGSMPLLLFLVWMAGLVAWCLVFLHPSTAGSLRSVRKRAVGGGSKDV